MPTLVIEAECEFIEVSPEVFLTHFPPMRTHLPAPKLLNDAIDAEQSQFPRGSMLILRLPQPFKLAPRVGPYLFARGSSEVVHEAPSQGLWFTVWNLSEAGPSSRPIRSFFDHNQHLDNLFAFAPELAQLHYIKVLNADLNPTMERLHGGLLHHASNLVEQEPSRLVSHKTPFVVVRIRQLRQG